MNECPDCDEGELRATLTERVVDVEGRKVQVPNVIALVCTVCGSRSWPAPEVERTRQVAKLLIEKAA